MEGPRAPGRVSAPRRGRRTGLAAALVCAALAGPALGASDELPRLALVLDGSGSMWGRIEEHTKIEIAREVVSSLLADWDPRVELGLVAYGHRRKGDCSDIEPLVPVGLAGPRQIERAVAGIQPRGKTPIGGALELAARELESIDRPATVILVTDGRETCHVDPCDVARALEERSVDFTAHVVGFDVDEETQQQLSCVAAATGGLFLTAENAPSLRLAIGRAVQEATRNMRPGIWIAAALADDRRPIAEPVQWRIEPVAAAIASLDATPLVETESPTIVTSLEPGRYRVVAQYEGLTGVLAFSVDESRTGRYVVGLNAGRLELSAVDYGRNEQLYQGVRWRIYSMDGTVADSVEAGSLVAESTVSPQSFTLPAGRYGVLAEHDGTRQQVSLVLEPGQVLRKPVRFGSGRVALRASLSETSAPVRNPVQWQIRRIELGREQVVHEEIRPTWLVTLEHGDYEVSARYGDANVTETLRVRPGSTQTHTLDLSAGTARIFAVLPPPGGPIQQTVAWEVFALGSQSGEERRIAATESAAHSFTLPAGRYRVSGRFGDLAGSGVLEVRAGSSTSLGVVLR